MNNTIKDVSCTYYFNFNHCKHYIFTFKGETGNNIEVCKLDYFNIKIYISHEVVKAFNIEGVLNKTIQTFSAAYVFNTQVESTYKDLLSILDLSYALIESTNKGMYFGPASDLSLHVIELIDLILLNWDIHE